MPASIYGERFLAARGGPAWHLLGTVLDDPEMSAVDAIALADIDFEYRAVPIGYELPDAGFVHDAQRMAILRGPSKGDPSWKQLGVMSNEYHFLQNQELAEGIDRVRAATGWQLETVGALGDGETVFMSLYAGKRDVKGDELDSYFLVSDNKSGQRSLVISNTPMRTVCKNTLQLAEAKASAQVKLQHHPGVDDEFAMWTDVIPALEKAEESAFADLDRMASVQIDRAQAEKIIAAAYPLPKTTKKVQAAEVLKTTALVDVDVLARLLDARDAHEQSLDRMLAIREAVMGRYDALNDNVEGLDTDVIGAIAGTPYMALQAVSETVDWGDSRRGRKSDSAAIFGEKRNIKVRAWNAALSAAKW